MPALSRAQCVGCCTAVLRLLICVVACALLHGVSPWLCDCATLRGIVFIVVDCSCACVSLRCVHACVTAALQRESGVALRVCCRWWRRRSVAVRATHSRNTCPGIVRAALAVAVSHCCSARADSDCNTVAEVLCAPPGVAALDAAAHGRGRVCNAALPLCVTSVVTSRLSVQCIGVCSCGAVCFCVLFCFRERQCAVVSVCCCVAVLLCCCVWHCASLDGRVGCQKK